MSTNIKRRHACARVAGILAISSIACGVIFAQAVSQISGTATDQTAAVVPGVQVTAPQTETGAKRTSESDAAGGYLLPNVPIGPYRVEASKAVSAHMCKRGLCCRSIAILRFQLR